MKKKAFLNIAKVMKMFNLQLFAEPNTNVTTDALTFHFGSISTRITLIAYFFF